MEPTTVKQIMAEAMANVKLLGACKGGHQFHELPGDVVRLGKRYECSKCGGKIDRSAHYWYTLGQQHGTAKT
jgi:hypothetical protein